MTTSYDSRRDVLNFVCAENNVDDTTTVAFNIAPQTTLYLPVVVRRVMATGTGADITATLIA